MFWERFSYSLQTQACPNNFSKSLPVGVTQKHLISPLAILQSPLCTPVHFETNSEVTLTGVGIYESLMEA